MRNTSSPVCPQPNEPPLASLALSPGTLPLLQIASAALSDKDTPTPAREDDKKYNTANGPSRSGRETDALAINPCCGVDKLIACTAISTPVSNIEEPSARVIL